MTRLICWFLVVWFGMGGALSNAASSDVRRSVVRISATWEEPNYRVPWMSGSVRGGTGAGFVIKNNRILTNAHVVSNARFLGIEKENDPKRYVAIVEHIAHDCDLAVLKVTDPAFFRDAVPLEFGGIPELESVVAVFGYPIGGERLSVTHGVVSRIDYQTYSHSQADSHLAIQIDAAINPGNSGGPVLQDGRVVGVAFQGYSGAVAQNVGYMIPVSVVLRFLKDIEDGHYNGYMDMAITTFQLRNPAQRRALGLADDDRGIVVTSVMQAGCSWGVLKPDDVLLAIDGHTIFSDGSVDLDKDRLEMAEVVERKFMGDKVTMSILREKKPMEVTLSLKGIWPNQMQSNQYDERPRYLLFAGLLFQPLSRDLIRAHDLDDVRVRFYFNCFMSDELYVKHPDVIVLSTILPDPINTYLGEFRNGILDEINGVKIRTLKEASDLLAKPADQYVLRFIGKGRPLVLERRTVEAARERIRKRYNVVQQENLDGENHP